MRKPPACEKKCESQFSELQNQYRENCTPSAEEHSCLLNLDRLCDKTGGGKNNRAKKKINLLAFTHPYMNGLI